jgi:hypothetical protein
VIRVRPVRADDLPALAELIVRSTGFAGDVERVEGRLASVLHGHPWPDVAIRSLLAEDVTGKAQGFLVVLPRAMRIGGRAVRAAVAGPLIVHPECRHFPGTRLLRALLDGPQDLSLMDVGGCATRTVWERLGGSAAVLYNLSWTRPLRLSTWALGRLRGRLGAPARIMLPFARFADAVLSRMPASPVRPAPSAELHEVRASELAVCIERVAARWLHASHDGTTLSWLLERAAARAGGPLRAFVVGSRDASAGYVVMSTPRAGIAHVVQMAAESADAADGVVRAILAHAAAAGCVAVTGRVDSRFLNDLTDRGAMLHASGSQTLVHARDATLARHVERGEAVLGRLDGAWWLPF